MIVTQPPEEVCKQLGLTQPIQMVRENAAVIEAAFVGEVESTAIQ
jgi:hypothetical protein